MVKKEKVKKRKKVKIIKAPRIQTIFCIVSILFIISCFIFYGTRLVKYYKVYNPKSSTGEVLANLSSKITSESSIIFEGDGLYNSNGSYIYKGNDVKNYILVSNMLFRIMKINNDKSIDIVLDEYINKLSYNEKITSYLDSSLNKYLKDNFLNNIDKDLLIPTNICTQTINEMSEINCNLFDTENYIRIPGINDFLNSINDSKSYLVKENENIWLYNHGEKNVWHTSGVSIANSLPEDIYAIKPVMTLKNSTIYITGDGSLENPYQIKEKEEIKVGTYLDIEDDIYIVYEVGNDYLKLQNNKLLSSTYIFDKKTNDYKESSLKNYLENEYLDTLSYKDILKEVEFDDYESKIGILTKNDLKFNSSLKGYFLSDKKDNNIYIYNSSTLTSKVNIKRNIRPCIGVKKDLKIISGNGSKIAPFIVEV